MFGNQSFRIGPSGALPPAIKNIIFANVVIFVMTFLNRDIAYFFIDNFGLKSVDVI